MKAKFDKLIKFNWITSEINVEIKLCCLSEIKQSLLLRHNYIIFSNFAFIGNYERKQII